MSVEKHEATLCANTPDALDCDVIVSIRGLKKQNLKQHNGKYGLIVQHKLNTVSNRHRVRLLEDHSASKSKKPSQMTMIYDSFGLDDPNASADIASIAPTPSFTHLYIKDEHLFPQCKIGASAVHKQGISALQNYRCGDCVYDDIALLTCPGFELLWKNDASTQITKLWCVYCKMDATKRAYFDEILFYDEQGMLHMDVTHKVNRLSMEPTFKLRYTCTQATDATATTAGPKDACFDFMQWCKVITTFKLNALDDSVYYISSNLNHSCRPNVYLTHDGTLKAIRDIESGEELLVSYLKRDASLYKYQQLRSMEIQRTKGFYCKCVRCQVDHPPDLIWDDARNFKCQHCHSGIVSWNTNSSRLYTACNNSACGTFPSTLTQSKYMATEKKLSVFLLENTGDIDVNALKMKAHIPSNKSGGDDDDDDKKEEDNKSKLSAELKMLLMDAQKYLARHYLLIALYHRLCQVNLHIDWLRLRYKTMCEIYAAPNDCLLRACIEYHRFIPLLTVADIMNANDRFHSHGQNKQSTVNKYQTEMDGLEAHIECMKEAIN